MSSGPGPDWIGLHIHRGQHTRPWAPDRGLWLKHPTADFRCRCGFTDSASGDAVPTFVATIRRSHAAACPLTPTRKSAA